MNKTVKMVLYIFILITVSLNIYSKELNDVAKIQYDRAITELDKSFKNSEMLFKKVITDYPSTIYASLSVDILIEKYYQRYDYQSIINIYNFANEYNIKLSPEKKIIISSIFFYSGDFLKTLEILNSFEAENIKNLEDIKIYYYLSILSSINLDEYLTSETLIDIYTNEHSDDVEIYSAVASAYLKKNISDKAFFYIKKYCDKQLQKDFLSVEEIESFLILQSAMLKLGKYGETFEYLNALKIDTVEEERLQVLYKFEFGIAAYYLKKFDIARDALTYAINNTNIEATKNTCQYILEMIGNNN